MTGPEPLAPESATCVMCDTQMPTGHYGTDHVAPAFHPDGSTSWRCVDFHACAARIAASRPAPRTAGGRLLSEYEMRGHAWGLMLERVAEHRRKVGIPHPDDH